MTLARTVLGDVPGERLGPVDYHEHLFQVSPLLPGDELDDEPRSEAEAAALRAAGIATMIDATPLGLGGRPAALAGISARTGLTVVAATGAHREAHYPSGHWLRRLTVEELATRFTTDVRDGFPDAKAVRAGIVKTGVGYWSISPFERRVLAAAAAAHRDTGAPVMVHLEHGSAAFEVLDVLGEGGVHASAVVLAHVDRNPDPGLHAELAGAGAFLGYDGPARHREQPDSAVIDCLVQAAARGAAGHIVLGGDVARASRYVAYGGLPGLVYLPLRFLPRLRQEGGEALVRAVTIDNPRRLLARFTDPNQTDVKEQPCPR